jgi:hypothetical protein
MFRGLTAAALVGALGLSPAPALAKSKDKHKHKVDKGVVFVDTDRDAVRGYWIETYGRGHCPPGLAKKGNGCLPPGQAKKRYVVGRSLPGGIVVQPLPPILLPRLRPVPAGYEYGVLDGDVLLMAIGTRLVVDAIAGLID